MHKPLIVGTLSLQQSGPHTSIDLCRAYDLVLSALSWERRATSAVSAIKELKSPLTLLKFASSSEEMEAAKAESLKTFQTLTGEISIVELQGSTQFQKNADRLVDLITERVTVVGRPIKILVDITCMPKAYSLFLMGMGFANGYISRIDCIYAEGAYSLADPNTDQSPNPDPRSIISDGEWASLQVPYFSADVAIPNSRDIIVAMGGEIGLSLPFIEKYEPVMLSLALITESIVQQPELLLPGERAALDDLLSEPNAVRINVPLCDVSALADHAVTFARSSGSEVVSAIALGSKPHALALGLAALSEPNLEIICRVPKRYKPLDVAPLGPIWLYEIEDRFEPSAYF
ncbi:hypothetical protein GGQ87_000825 [Brevundimonas alba]|uniref:Uncharacterized protein n=1 Tax=Brevundimonas alba TaxID=74314 RepID=A0A7X6BMN5_9CAUL|nr:hypothetical protein [Brevundimonas alba]NJC40567.1 hypothetical protein [Brevundimonas alba]